MMLPFLLLTLFLGAGFSFEFLGQKNNPRLELPVASPDLIESYKLFLKSTLTPKGTARRNLLVAAGIIPHPPTFRSRRHFYENVISDRYFVSEIYEYIKKQVYDILDSEERFDQSLRSLFGERLPAEEFTVFKETTTHVPMTARSVDYSKETTTLNYVESDNLDDASIKEEFEPLLFGTADSESDGGTSSSNLVTENTEAIEPSSYFKKFIAESLLFHGSKTVSTTDSISEYPTESDDHFSQTVSPAASEDTNFVTVGYDTTQTYATTDSVNESHIDGTKVSFETRLDYLTTEPLSTVTRVPENDVDDSTIYELNTSEYLQSLLSQTIPIADVQLIDKIIPVSADEYKYLVETRPSSVEPTTIKESQSDQKKINISNIMTETETNSSEIIKQINSEIMAMKEELQRQIYKYRGIPGKHFPNYEDIPDTSFVCHNKKHIPGFYADQESRCQVFHVCWPFRRETFLCPIGTTFNQAILACDYWYKSNCSLSQAYFDVNLAFDDSTKAGTVGPMVETLLKATEKDRPIRTEVLSSSKDVSKLYIADVHFSESTANEELTQIWKFLPIKVKILIYPEPKFMDAVRAVINEARKFQRESELNASKFEDQSDFETENNKKSKQINFLNLGILRELSLQKDLEVNSV